MHPGPDQPLETKNHKRLESPVSMVVRCDRLVGIGENLGRTQRPSLCGNPAWQELSGSPKLRSLRRSQKVEQLVKLERCQGSEVARNVGEVGKTEKTAESGETAKVLGDRPGRRDQGDWRSRGYRLWQSCWSDCSHGR